MENPSTDQGHVRNVADCQQKTATILAWVIFQGSRPPVVVMALIRAMC